MKSGIHPEYEKALITCACGRATETRSTVGELHVEICSHCHPFFTGRQKLVDTAGRVERFMAKYGMEDGEEQPLTEVDPAEAEGPEPAAEPEQAVPADESVEPAPTEAEIAQPTDAEGQSEASDPGTDEAEEVDEEAGAAIDA